MSWAEKHQRELREQRRTAHLRIVTRVGKFLLATILLATILDLYFIRWFVAWLPGPRPSVEVNALSPPVGDGVGCTFYSFSLTLEQEPVDYVYFKMQFPNLITGYKFGMPAEKQGSDSRNIIQAGVFEGGRNGKGQCDALTTGEQIANDLELRVDAYTVFAHANKLLPMTKIDGMIATSAEPTTDAPPRYFEGEYEYTILGQVVRKKLKFTYQELPYGG